MRVTLLATLAFAKCTSTLVLCASSIVLCALSHDAAASDAFASPSSARPSITLVTRLGDRLPGHWLATDNPAQIVWQVDGFVGPFQLAKEQVSEIEIRHQEKVPQIEGTYRCELANGDVLIGNPLSLDDSEFVFQIPGSEPLSIERTRLRKLSPWKNRDQAIRCTPSALEGWHGSQRAWRASAGRMTATEEGVELSTVLNLGEKSQLSLRIAWEQQPDFRIDFGAGDNWDQGLRLETWRKELVIVAESPQAADLLLVAGEVRSGGELLLHLFIDTSRKTIIVTTDTGGALGKLSWRGELKKNFRIRARRPGFHFYSATVTSWDGLTPQVLGPVEPRVITREGTTERAVVTAWNADSQTWSVAAEDDSLAATAVARHYSGDEIEAILFTGQPLRRTFAEQRGSVRAVARTGMKITGQLIRLSDDSVQLDCRGVRQPIAIPLSHLRSLAFLPERQHPSENLPRTPRLRLGSASIVGQLVEGVGDQRASALAWKPSASTTAAHLAHAASGSITLREPPPQPAKRPDDQPKTASNLADRIASLFTAARPGPTLHESSPGPTLHLRTGDSLPCLPERIDGEGVTFTSPITEATFAPQAALKALVLVGGFQPARVTQEQRQRLLTLPRAQQEYPPSHLLLSVDGDLLRTRVTAMDDQSITTELRLNEVVVPRKRVAAIAWLHDDPPEPDRQEIQATSTFLQVQAVQSDGVRLTFRPREFTDGILSGTSDVLGHCRVEIAQVEKLVFGKAINEALQLQSHQLLSLRPAVAPRFVTDANSAPTPVGQGSALVGRKAPPLVLTDLGGATFDLAEHRGKVVVLDFWATWCGPCVQWMPQLEAIVANYSPEDVELVTINLMQEIEAIRPALERMQINPIVLLDRDGVAADAYQAAAIPQTVIVDQRGNIDRLFIGGSAQIKQPVIDALDALTGAAN